MKDGKNNQLDKNSFLLIVASRVEKHTDSKEKKTKKELKMANYNVLFSSNDRW